MSTKNGYGQTFYEGKIVYAHRLAYQLTHGPIPHGALVCHRCDTRRCVNPLHLFLGTHKDNTQDMLNKDRHKSRLSRQDVEAIRSAYIGKRGSNGSRADLAHRFHVNVSTIYRIVNGHSQR